MIWNLFHRSNAYLLQMFAFFQIFINIIFVMFIISSWLVLFAMFDIFFNVSWQWILKFHPILF